jgi:hypothetical protein
MLDMSNTLLEITLLYAQKNNNLEQVKYRFWLFLRPFDWIKELSRECGILFVFVSFYHTNYQFYCILTSIKMSGFFYSIQ